MTILAVEPAGVSERELLDMTMVRLIAAIGTKRVTIDLAKDAVQRLSVLDRENGALRQQLAEMRGANTLSDVELQGLYDAVAMAVVAAKVASGDEHKRALRMRNTLQNLYGRFAPPASPSQPQAITQELREAAKAERVEVVEALREGLIEHESCDNWVALRIAAERAIALLDAFAEGK